ncbi:MAG: sigma 54-interacting transcriptional regulator [Pirellulales bacterium]|nr:sigma 54-interacting transcriptional regulator [Pirellulales bacterium]
MERFQRVLLGVWQEACRHIEIGQSTANIAAMLVRHVPIERILVRRIDVQRSVLETVAVGPAEPEHCPTDVRSECMPAELEALLAWCRGGKVARLHGGKSSSDDLPVDKIVPGRHRGDVLIGPLGDPAEHCGVLVFIATKDRAFDPKHVELAQLLIEPFAVALDNDLRLREIAALREAAEADNRSLLMRLGRESLGETIVGADSGLRAVMERVELVARSDAPVLVFGATGTGKELIARAIHNRSSRRRGPFNRVNCGAIPPELIDTQLFGHERGAFTGAVGGRRGWFERADGGTLFLDEIGELPPAAQVRMLRILQDGWMERVGAEKPINVDVRIVAATHRDLARMVAEGSFREDLWYRIAVFPIVLPPLRERREDIAKLAVHFAGRAATRFGLAPVAPTAEDLAMLAAYPWPGNVRELAAVIDRAAILGDGKRLDVATALGVGTTSGWGGSSTAAPAEESKRDVGWGDSSTAASTDAAPREVAEIEALETIVRRHIEVALTAAGGQIEGRRGAAAMLQVNPHTLRARMRKLGIQWSSFRGKQ